MQLGQTASILGAAKKARIQGSGQGSGV